MPNTMMFPSTPSVPSSFSAWTHDVFLSFRGEDTRKTFTDHLYAALTGAGVSAFIDDAGLPRGENITAELARAIQGSRMSIVVFSRRYAESAWCLEELFKIMECRRTIRQTVLPVFYDVDPSHVRNQTGVLAEAFLKHEERFRLDLGKVLRWREALAEAANLSGWDLRNTADGHESTFIKKIIEEVSRQLKNTYLFVALYPVGIESRLQAMSSLLGIPTDDKVHMVGIWGMGGLGKTTIAKAIYNQFNDRFEGRSFLANVREIWSQPNHRVSLQEQLLSDILKRKVKLDNVDRGIMEIKERICRMKVLVIVDDVDDVDQLNGVARSPAWFGAGSIIIITTRDKHILEELKVSSICAPKQMSCDESLELFCWHAFRRNCPDQDFVELSKGVVNYCAGLPLALEVLGSHFFLVGA